jgi:precorrin-6Y C5,15-methyltransferase (decarboxylating) CbiT subunit
MTKREVRALTICAARLKPDLTVWDVGAGTGSLSVEAALFTPGGQVFAVEKKAAGLDLIARNRKRFGATNLMPVSGEAPDALAGLPDPHRILVGGSGGRLAEILKVCKQRLLPGGVIVVNVISPRNLTVVLDALHAPPFIHPEGVYLQASRLEKLGQEDVFRAQNGVWIISAEKEGDTYE